jgi:SSS family solute:Na+ symporter
MVAILFVVTVLLMLLLGKLWPMPVPYNRAMQPAGTVDLKPWKHRHIFAVILIALMVLVFVIFSPVGLVK